jgi:hypothetical protein
MALPIRALSFGLVFERLVMMAQAGLAEPVAVFS